MEKVFLAFTKLTEAEAKTFIDSHIDQIRAAEGTLDVQHDAGVSIFRLTLPETMTDVSGEMVLPDFRWMQVQGQVVPLQQSTLDIDTMEATRGKQGGGEE